MLIRNRHLFSFFIINHFKIVLFFPNYLSCFLNVLFSNQIYCQIIIYIFFSLNHYNLFIHHSIFLSFFDFFNCFFNYNFHFLINYFNLYFKCIYLTLFDINFYFILLFDFQNFIYTLFCLANCFHLKYFLLKCCFIL